MAKVNEEGKNASVEAKASQEMEQSGGASPCSSFFQLKGAIDHKNYLRLKNAEKEMIVQYKAATVIQAAWRGFLVRENMKILHASAARVQGLFKGVIARKKYRPLILDLLEALRKHRLDIAATKIQAWFRGIMSRKNAFDFKKYKDIMHKNMELQRNIQMINDMEEMLRREFQLDEEEEEEEEVVARNESSIESLRGRFGSLISTSSSSSAPCTRDKDTLDCLVKTSFNELSKSLSKCRVEELLKYVATSASDPLRNNRRDSTASIRETSSGGANLRVKDSLDDLFPEFPEEEGLVKPDPEKVGALKTAIRLLREKIKNENHRRLLKQHYLLRTSNIPGVYSNIYSNELTDIEKELKGVKFLNTTAGRKSKVPLTAATVKVVQREPWKNYVSPKNNLCCVRTANNNTGAYSGKNLKRHLNLRKRGANHAITKNGHSLTPIPATTETESSNLRTTTDGNSDRIEEDTEEMVGTTKVDDYGDAKGSVRPMPNPNTV